MACAQNTTTIPQKIGRAGIAPTTGGSMDIQFKTTRIEAEFNGADTEGIIMDPRVRAMCLELHHWLRSKGRPGLFLTCIIRTEEENAELVKSNPKSAHITGRAVDIRTIGRYSPETIKEIIEHVYDVWGKAFAYILFHDSGNGDHIHMNMNFPFARKTPYVA